MGAIDLVNYAATFRNAKAAAASAALCIGFSSTALASPDYLGAIAPESHGTPQQAKVVCAACHGANGIATSATFPNLAGQKYGYLLKSLEEFRSGKWKFALMNQMVATVPQAKDNANLRQIAAYFSRLKAAPQALERAHGTKPTQAVAEAGFQI